MTHTSSKVVRYGANTYVHSFRALDASFFDAAFATLVRESYIRGCQKHYRYECGST